MIEHKACPFCGHDGGIKMMRRARHWGAASCRGCGARGPEVMLVHPDFPDMADWKLRAGGAWDIRRPNPAALVAAYRELLHEAMNTYEAHDPAAFQTPAAVQFTDELKLLSEWEGTDG